MTIINDGNAEEMTCCPVRATNVFSSNPNEQSIPRKGKCLADEVGVGMIDPFDSSIYCRKINTALYKLSDPVTAKYVSISSSVPEELRAIADAYHSNDTCLCPPKYILRGNHTPDDNKCTDECVQILPK